MLQPKRRKYRKEQKGRNTGVATRGSSVSFGDFGLKAVGRGRLTARQIESARRAMTRHIKRGGRIGFGYSLTSQSRKNLQKYVWVTVKVTQSTTLLKFSRARFCMRWMASMKLWHAKLSAWPPLNCRFKQPS